jgi:hypothetical protein
MNYHSVIETKGVRATTLAETLRHADLDFKVLTDDVVGSKSGAIMPRKKLLYRSDNKEALGVVGSDYCPTEPKEFIETQFEFAREVGGKVVRAGWVGRRSKAFAIVKMDTIELPCGTKTKDPINLYIYSTDSWDGGSPRSSTMYLERLACLNGMMTQELSTSLRVSHTKNATERFENKLKPFLAEIETKAKDARVKFQELIKAKMGTAEMERFLERLLPGKGGQTENKRKELLELFQHGTGTHGQTRWDALNAVTEYVTHKQTYRDTNIASADTSRFLGVLERNTMNERALNLLLN